MSQHVSVSDVIAGLQAVFTHQGKSKAVIAVSGGIDSAVAVTLLTRALGPAAVEAFLLPYGTQDMTDARMLGTFNNLPATQCHEVNIEPLVTAAEQLGLAEGDQVRRGNLMARSRMLVVFDWAKKLDALVCGTENKSEHYLGYFTRFGDAASDIEPLTAWYKTDVRQVARELGLPEQIITKAPSAGLWGNQTDEAELGFTYEQADAVMRELIDRQGWDGQVKPAIVPEIPGVDAVVVEKIISQIVGQAFKRLVPYTVTIKQ